MLLEEQNTYGRGDVIGKRAVKLLRLGVAGFSAFNLKPSHKAFVRDDATCIQAAISIGLDTGAENAEPWGTSA